MLRADEIQSAIVQYLKGYYAITSLLKGGSNEEIREDQWQGTDFIYPNIRIKLSSLVPLNSSCNAYNATFSIVVFSEQSSSFEADRIAGIINSVLHKRSFSSQGVRFCLWTNNLIPAIRSDRNTWRSEVLMRGTIN